MKLTIVGASGSMSGPTSAASSYLLQEEADGRTYSIAFDLGPGAFGQLWKYVDPQELDALFLSHCHADHMGDIVSMYVHRKWHPTGCLGAIPVYGPAESADRTAQIDGWAARDELEETFRFIDLSAGQSHQIGPFSVLPFQGKHTVESYGFRVEASGQTFAYTGDTDSCPEMEQMSEDVDLLLSECGFTAADTVRGIHLDGERVGQLASAAGVKNLVVTHIQPWTPQSVVSAEVRSSWDGPLSFAEPGQTYQVGAVLQD